MVRIRGSGSEPKCQGSTVALSGVQNGVLRSGCPLVTTVRRKRQLLNTVIRHNLLLVFKKSEYCGWPSMQICWLTAFRAVLFANTFIHGPLQIGTGRFFEINYKNRALNIFLLFTQLFPSIICIIISLISNGNTRYFSAYIVLSPVFTSSCRFI